MLTANSPEKKPGCKQGSRGSCDSGQHCSGSQSAQDDFGSGSHATRCLVFGCEFRDQWVPLEIFLNFRDEEWLNTLLLFILVSFRQ